MQLVFYKQKYKKDGNVTWSLPDKVKNQNQEVLECNGIHRMEDPLVSEVPV